MRFTVRLYDPSEQEQPLRPIATVVLNDQRERACWLPDHVAAEARFFLERVETESAEVEQRVRVVLQRPFVIVSKSSAHVTGAVRTRGDYSAREHHGTPTYWRAAIGRLESEAGLTDDLEDYGRMLQGMEAYDLQDYGQTLQHHAVAYNARGVLQARRGDWDAAARDMEAALPIARERLAAALHRLASVRQDLRERLTAWREQVERGVSCGEACLRMLLTAGQAGTVAVLPAMSHPSLQAAYAGTGIRGEGGETIDAGQGARAVVITTDAVPSARVAVEADIVVVTFLGWQAPSPPLVVLVSDDERSAPQTSDHLDREDDKWTARFERIPVGTYLLAVAPVSSSPIRN